MNLILVRIVQTREKVYYNFQYTYFPNVCFVILLAALVLMFIYWWCKSCSGTVKMDSS